MKKYHSFGKSVMTALLVTILIGATLGCSEVSPDKPSLQSIAVTSPPTKTVYTVGEALDISGIKVTGTYAGGTTKTEPVGESNISEYNKDATGEQTVTVTVSGKTATFTVTVNAPESNAVLQSIAITGSPTKTAYVRGDELDLSGLMVTGTYDDGTTKPETVSLADISGYNKEATGEQTLTVTVGGKTATFTVTVNNTALQSIAVTSPPTKTVYALGETLNISGLVVTGTYADDTTKVESVSLSNISGYNKDATGEQTLTVTVNGETATFTVTVSEPLDGLDGLANAPGGDTATNPVLVAMKDSLANGGWEAILSAIAEADKYVSLDLSACTMDGTEFDPGTDTGSDKITALILPGTAQSIKAGTSDNPTFKAFTALRSISGTDVKTVGDYAFYYCDSLTSVSLPVAQIIGDWAFRACTSLASVSLPVATSIGDYAFHDCYSLASVSLPVATTIGDRAFSSCYDLTEVSLPVATTIDYYAFRGCTSLASVSLPVAQTIGSYAFYGCTNLTSVSLPAAETIGARAFYGCTSLVTVSLPTTPPTLGSDIFVATYTDTITIRVPTGVVSAYTSAWGVDANTAHNGNTSVYGNYHKAVLITDAAQ